MDHYVANLYAAGTSTPLLDSLDIGKPTPDAFNQCTVDISTWLDGQADGDYEVRVAEVDGAANELESSESNAFTVPLSSS